MKYVFQYLMAITILIISTFAAWYEGSSIRLNSFEWRYSAIFSKLFNGEIKNIADISELDHFVYAAKFSPTFPILMVFSFSYLLMISSYLVLRKKNKSIDYFASNFKHIVLIVRGSNFRFPNSRRYLFYYCLINY